MTKRELSRVQKLHVRLAAAFDEEEFREVLADARRLRPHASPDERRSLRQLEAMAQIQLGAGEEAMRIFRDEIAKRRGRSRDGFMSVAAAWVGKAAKDVGNYELLLEILNFPADPVVRAEYLYNVLQVLPYQTVENAPWADVAQGLSDVVGDSDPMESISEFEAYAGRFFADRRDLNKALTKGEAIEPSNLRTSYWRRRLENGYPLD